MKFMCEKCNNIIEIDDKEAGNNIVCEKCNQEVTVPANKFAPNSIINDFVIIKELARGGMGIVYLAKQISLDRLVALKILMDDYTKDHEFVEQFIQESRAAAKLNHPNVVQAYAVGEEDGIFFFAMEYIDGTTMKSVLKEEGKIAPIRAAKVIRDIANALEFAWTGHKIVHQDIKPDNIMLNSRGVAKLADLGLAKSGDTGLMEDDEEEEVLGTPHYISPEQMLGEPTDVRSDIYSLGATFYHLITGTFPFIGDSVDDVARKHVEEALEEPRKRDKSVPISINRIIVKMMNKDIKKRHQSAEELIKELNSAIAKLEEQEKLHPTQAKTAKTQEPKLPRVNPSKVSAPKIVTPEKKQPVTPPPVMQLKKPTVAVPTIGNTNEAPKLTMPSLKVAPPAQVEEKKNDEKLPPKTDEVKEENLPVVKKAKVNKTVIIIIISAIIALGAIAGVAFFTSFGKNLLAKVGILKANNEQTTTEEETKVAEVVEVKPTPKKVVVKPEIKVVKRQYVEDLTALQLFIDENPNREQEFLRRFDDFLDKYTGPENTIERNLYSKVIPIYNAIDERLRVETTRNRLKKEHLVDVKYRAEIAEQEALEAKYRAENEARLKEDARILAEQKAEQARLLAEEKKLQAENKREAINQYNELTKDVMPKLLNLFWSAVKNNGNNIALKQYVATLPTLIAVQDKSIIENVAKNRFLLSSGNDLLANIKATQEMYNNFVGVNNKFKGVTFEYSIGNILTIVSPHFEHSYIEAKNSNNRQGKVNIAKDSMREKVFGAVERQRKLENLEFYYQLFFHADKKEYINLAPNKFWKNFDKYQ